MTSSVDCNKRDDGTYGEMGRLNLILIITQTNIVQSTTEDYTLNIITIYLQMSTNAYDKPSSPS